MSLLDNIQILEGSQALSEVEIGKNLTRLAGTGRKEYLNATKSR